MFMSSKFSNRLFVPFVYCFTQYFGKKVSSFPVQGYLLATQYKQSFQKSLVPIERNFILSTSAPFLSARLRSTMSSSENENIVHVKNEYIPPWFQHERIRVLTESITSPTTTGKSVIYWMQRDMRTADNWALLFAMNMAKDSKLPLRVVTILTPPDEQVERMTKRHAYFLLGGLKEVEKELKRINVGFDVLCPSSSDDTTTGKTLFNYATNEDNDASAVICDFNPLRLYRRWTEKESSPLFTSKSIPLYQVDAHNIVPVWEASPKREVGARTLRPKINKKIGAFMTHFPKLDDIVLGNQTKIDDDSESKIDWKECYKFLKPDKLVDPVKWAQPGTNSAMKLFESFQKIGLKNFDTLRNDPNHRTICSNLSPWINHGHISFQRLALDVRANKKYPNGTAAYIEEGVVRRELSDNYVYYAPDTYDSLLGAAQWAQDSLELHSTDEREFLYSKEEFESGSTHDDLWNAAQFQLVQEAKMHGFVSYSIRYHQNEIRHEIIF